MSGLFVAAIMNTCFLASRPSISVSIWFTTRALALDSAMSERLGHRASSSSKKMTQGAEFLALRKTCLTAFSLSPTYIFRSSGPFTDMKLMPDSFAIALANKVFPHPGGPANRIPCVLVKPKLANCCGYRTGARIAMLNSSLMSTNAPTSAQVTSGTVTNPSLLAEGCTMHRASLKSSMETYTDCSCSGLRGGCSFSHCKVSSTLVVLSG